MSVKPGNGEDEEGNGGKQSWPVQTNRYGFILGNGEIDSDVPCPESVRHRESKWLSLMTQWEQVMEKKSNKVKSQCQKGIPASVRAKCWPLLCGAKNRKDNNRELYKRLVEAQDLQGWTDIIKRDTDRQFPFHEMFQSSEGHGQKDLLEVLRAYTQYRPDEGYCQAQGPVAAVLLMNMPAQDAFWCLAQISELFLPGYYSPLLEGVLFDAAVLSSVLKKLCPTAHKHMQNQGVEPLMFATDWLMCLYSRHLPFNTLLRVWDLFFCYGVRVLFQVAVVLVHRCLGEARQRRECEGQMETLERLRGVKQHILNEQADAFIHEVCSVPLSLSELRKQTEKEMEKWKRERPNSNFDPRGRCHGHQMAWERTQEKQKGREQQKKNLVVTVMRSHSSLSPLVRKKWRKQRSNTNIEEWDGGGKNFLEESDFQENRRRSMCGLVGEKKGNWDSVLPQHMSKIDNKPCKISLEESYSLERKQRKDELENDSREKEKDNGQMGTYATGNPTEEKRDLQMGLDEHTVKMTTTLQTCNKKALFEQGSENRKQEVHSGSNIQKDEIHTEICMDAQGRLVKPIVPELENTPQEQRHPPQQEQLTDLPIELRTEDNVETLHSVEILKEPDKEEGIDQDLGNTNAIAEPSKTSEESDNKEDTVELRDCNLCSDVCVEGDVKVISRFSPQSKQGSVPSIRLPDLTESQDRENNMIVIFSAIKVDHCPIVTVGSDDLQQSELENRLQEEGTASLTVSSLSTKISPGNQVSSNLYHGLTIDRSVHLESNRLAMDESMRPKDNVVGSALDSGDVCIAARPVNLKIDIRGGPNKFEQSSYVQNEGSTEMEKGGGYSEDLESNAIVNLTRSGNQECSKEHREIRTAKLGTDEDALGNSEINSDAINKESNPVCYKMLQRGLSDNPQNSFQNLEFDRQGSKHLSDGFNSQNHNKRTEKTENSNTENALGSLNPEVSYCDNAESTTETGNQQCHETHAMIQPDNLGYLDTDVTGGTGNPGCNSADVGVRSGNPEYNDLSIISRSGNSESTPQKSPIESTKPINANQIVSPTQLRVRRTSSSRVSYPTILSEDTFREPLQHSAEKDFQDTHIQPISTTKSGPPKPQGFFRRLRGQTNKTPIPKILIQDFSGNERLTSKERRRKKREKEQEEKDRKKQEKGTEKERKKPQTRGKSFQAATKKCVDNVLTIENSDCQTSRLKRNSAPFTDGYS